MSKRYSKSKFKSKPESESKSNTDEDEDELFGSLFASSSSSSLFSPPRTKAKQVKSIVDPSLRFDFRVDKDIDGLSNFGLISDKEFKILSAFFSLSEAWGYRTGVDQDHERFELRTHTGLLLPLQSYTDILFRNFQQLHDRRANRRHVLFLTDVVDKAKQTMDLGADESVRTAVSQLLTEFIREPMVRDSMKRLSTINITDVPVSICFAGIVVAASAIMLMATTPSAPSSFKQAYIRMQTYYSLVSKFKESWEPDDEEQERIEEIEENQRQQDEELEKEHEEEEKLQERENEQAQSDSGEVFAEPYEGDSSPESRNTPSTLNYSPSTYSLSPPRSSGTSPVSQSLLSDYVPSFLSSSVSSSPPSTIRKSTKRKVSSTDARAIGFGLVSLSVSSMTLDTTSSTCQPLDSYFHCFFA